MGLALSRWGNWSRGPIPYRGNSLGQRRNFETESKAADLRQPKWNKNHTIFATAIHALDRDAGHLKRHRGWELELRDCRAIPGRGLLLTVGRQLGRREGGDCDGKCPCRKARQPWKQGDAAESFIVGRAIIIASPPPHPSTGTWTAERLALLASEVPNTRVGPQLGVPLHVPDVLSNREGPQSGEPSKCLNGWSKGEGLATKSFWLPASRG